MISSSNVDYVFQQFDERIGDAYVYGGDYSQVDPSVGCDCSYCVGWVLEALTKGPAQMSWAHNVSTESWPYDYATNTPAALGTVGPYGTITVANLADIPADAALIINIMHGGGGEDSHMNCVLQGQILESNGNRGSCTNGNGGNPSTASLWTDHWYLPGPIEGNTPVIPVVPLGLDYAGGRPGGTAIKAAGYSFVVRYLSDGGPGLPGKLLTPDEANDLRANGIEIVSNWETTADRALAGFDAGVADAQAALAQVLACGGRRDRPIYFSVDFDATPDQQGVIDAYMHGAGSVIPGYVGVYGGYWVVNRCLNSGSATWGWQTVAWSGSNVDPRINLYQRFGAVNVGGVECDVNEAHTTDYGQWDYQSGGLFMSLSPQDEQRVLDAANKILSVWASRSIYRHDNNSVDDTVGMLLNIDGSLHELVTEYRALLGYPDAIALVTTVAEGSGAVLPSTGKADPAAIARAQFILSKIPPNPPKGA